MKNYFIQTQQLNLKCTFHKAIDMCNHIKQSLIELSEMGFDWVLTSGGENNARARNKKFDFYG